ncbi:mask, partial [Symbiodinium sp. KB8]
LATIPAQQLSSVKALKRELQRCCGLSRFRQRLLQDGSALDDMSMLEGTSDLQLVLLPFSSASQQQADELADAAGEGEVSLVEELLQRPQDPDAHDRNGETPLYRASMVGCTETARLLLEAGANFDLACGQHHLTALVVAAGLGHVDTVRVLLQAGADQDGRDNLWD